MYIRAKEVGAGQQLRDKVALQLEAHLTSGMNELQNEVAERSDALILQANACKDAYRNYEAQVKRMERRKLDLQRAKMEAKYLNTLAYPLDQENGYPKNDFFQLATGPIQTETAHKVNQLMIQIDEAAEETHKIESAMKRKKDDCDLPQFIKNGEITRKKWCRADYNDVRTSRAAIEATKPVLETQLPTLEPWPSGNPQQSTTTYMPSSSSSASADATQILGWK